MMKSLSKLTTTTSLFFLVAFILYSVIRSHKRCFVYMEDVEIFSNDI